MSGTLFRVVCIAVLASLNMNSVEALTPELREGKLNQTNGLPTWFDPNTMRVVEDGDQLYLGYVIELSYLSYFFLLTI